MQCVILAGGLGTRLGAITKTLPKALVPVRNRPFIDYQLTWLERQLVTHVVLCVGHLGEQIVAHVGDGKRYGLAAEYVEDGPDLKGTAGALRRALDAGKLDDAFFVLYGDSFLPIAYPPVFARFREIGCAALMTVMRNEGRWDRSNVVYTPPRIALYDKHCGAAERARMTHIDYGLSVLSSALIEARVPAEATSDLAHLFHRLSIANELAAYEVTERFYEVGSPVGIADFAEYVAASGL
jgi:MurNAc alpha-1-phosphate uridylyltransferase